MHRLRKMMIQCSLPILLIGWPSIGYCFGPWDLAQVGGAFLTHLGIHETGHYIMAQEARAEETSLAFFKQKGNNFFLGLSTVERIDKESMLPYRLGGVAASTHLFDLSLSNYRNRPTTYNQALLLFSGVDFLWYSLWTLYIRDEEDPSYDPVGVSRETGLPPHAILGLAALQTALNTYRVYSGGESLVPYFGLERRRAEIGLKVMF